METENQPARTKEALERTKQLMDHLKWFGANGIDVRVEPTKKGYSLTLSVIKK